MTRHVAYSGNGELLWSNVIHDGSTGTNGSTSFDFDGDGTHEVVSQDESKLRVFDGRTGRILFEAQHTSPTAAESPIVADVDGDGHADIVAEGRASNGATVAVYSDVANRWVGTRPLWNQYSYHIDNINDDGSIPRQPVKSWLTHNTFRLNTFPDRHPLGQADLALFDLRLDESNGTAVHVLVTNRGLAPTAAATSVSILNGETLLGTLQVPVLGAGEERTLTLDGMTASAINTDLHARIDEANAIAECHDDNNATSAAFFDVRATDPEGLFESQRFTVTVENVNEAPGILSTALPSAASGLNYRYTVQARDPDLGDGLAFSLATAPIGMSIEQVSGELRWRPTLEQAGTHSVLVRVTDLAGLSAERSFELVVSNNPPPQITSTPITSAMIGVEYRYDVEATDPEVEALSFALTVAPAGIQLDANTGLIAWTPASGTEGPHEIEVRVTDARGAFALQRFTLTVAPPANQAPTIVSTPPTSAVAGTLYTYAVDAVDPDGDALSVLLAVKPEGMTLNELTGEIRWTPTAVQLATHAVQVQVIDGRGGVATQDFSITVTASGGGNQAPVISSQPAAGIELGATYMYAVIASDPDADPLSYSLTAAPLGMSLGSTNGSLTWTPSPAQVGTHAVGIRVSDGRGGFASQSFSVVVTTPSGGGNHAPTILSTPPAQAKVGVAYRYALDAFDADGDALVYSLSAGPADMQVDAATGVLLWTPASTGAVAVRVRVADAQSWVEQAWNLSVIAADVPLSATVTITPDPVLPGGDISIGLVVGGAAGELAVTATLDGAPIALPAQGTVTVPAPTSPGTHTVAVTVSDGNDTVTQSETFVVLDPNTSDLPVVQILSPTEAADEEILIVTAPTEVIGRVLDDNLLRWTLVLQERGGTGVTPLAEGTQAVDGVSLGRIDPTLLQNGQYVLILQGVDGNGQTVSDSRALLVEGDAKLGHFSVTFEDLSIPVAGLPVSVTRTYDTRQRGHDLDFGYGWSVGYQNVRIQESRRPGFGWTLTAYPSGPLGLIPNWCVESALGNVVSVTLADGKVEKFLAKAFPECNQGQPILDVELKFEPMQGTHSKLEAINGDFGRIVNGSLVVLDDPGNPIDPSRYVLTTPEGRELTLDQGFTVREVFEREGGNTITFDDDGILHSAGLSVVFVRNAQGRISEVHAPDGSVLRYEYDAQGNLSAFVDALGSRTTYTYLVQGGHYLEEIIDPRGVRVARNEYDDSGRLVAVIDADGRRIEYEHDLAGRAETIRDRRGITTVYVYNERGDVLAETNGAGETITRSYDSNGNTLTETNAAGETQTWTYDVRGNVLTHTNAAGETVTSTFGPFNQFRTQTDALGHVVLTNFYANVTVGGEPVYPGPLVRIADANGLETRFGYDSAGQLNALTDPSGAVSRMTYDGNGFLIARIEATGSRTDLVNDIMGRVLSETRTRTRADGTPETLRTEYTLDGKGRVTATRHPDGSVTHTDYDANDQPISQCDALNRCTTMQYDNQGKLERTDYADASFESSAYDANGNVIAQTDRGGRTTRMLYDAANRLIETIHPDAGADDGNEANNPRTRTTYDPAGRVQSVIDANGHPTRYEYDAAGRRSATVHSAIDGIEARTTTVYDAAGRPSATIDAQGHRTDFVSDAAGRVTETVHEDTSRSRVEYDTAGRKAAEIDAMGRRTEYAYDLMGRLTRVRLATGTSEQTDTGYAYDEVGNKVSQTDAQGRITRWEYDALGRQTARILPDGARETQQYNAAGELIAQTDFAGKTTRTEYDLAGRTSRTDYPNDADVTFSYNAAGERTQVIDGRGSSTASYDNRGRIVQSLDADGGLLEYQYDAAGNLIARISPSQSLVYTYDARNRLTQVSRTIDGEMPATTRYEYDEDGNRTAMLGAEGTRTEYSYDRQHRLTGLIKRTAASALLLAMSYSVDASGMRTATEESDAIGITRAVAYQYDAQKRLISETTDHRDNANDRLSQWTYDAVGNRLTQSLTQGGSTATTSYAYDNSDHLLTETGAAETTTYAYDANGNTTSKTNPSGTTSYQYNDANRLIQATSAAGTTAYTYNADGLRVSQTHTPTAGTPTTTWYVQDTAYPYAQVIEEYTSEGSGPKTLAATYTFADELVSQTRYDAGIPTTHFVQADGFGSTRWLTDGSGTLTDAIDYDAFGVEIGRSGSTEVEHLYRGERFDANVGFYDLRARLYNPQNGRFLTQDTYQGRSTDPASLHKYLYANADPVTYIDPTGQFSMASMGTALRVVGHLATIGIPTYNAVGNLRAGVSLGETTTQFAAEVTIGYAGGAILGRLLRFVPSIVPIRSMGSLAPAGGRLGRSMWNLGIHARGEAAELAVLGGNRSLPWNYPIIDDFTGGFATSIKSMDLIGKSPSYIRSQMMAAAEKLAGFVPRNWGAAGQLRGATVNGRNLVYVFEPGAADAAQAVLLKQIAQEIKATYPAVKVAFQWVP